MYNLLANYGTEIRQNQVAIAQQEDEISSLKELQSDLAKEQNGLIQSVASLELEGKLAKAELLGAETSKLSCDREMDDIEKHLDQIQARVAGKENKLSKLKKFKTRKIADFQTLHRKLEDQYMEMPHIRICVEAKRSYEEVASKLKETNSEIVQLTNELGRVRKIKSENWLEFKGICVAIAQNNGLAQRMNGELETLSLQKRRLEEMAELAHVNQESVTTSSETTTKRGGENLSMNDKLLKLHSRSKSISRSNISQRVFHPLPKAVGTLNRPVMLTSLTKLKSIPSALVGKSSGFSSTHVSTLLEMKQRLAARSGSQFSSTRTNIGSSLSNKAKVSTLLNSLASPGLKNINGFPAQIQEEPMETDFENYERGSTRCGISKNENTVRLPLAPIKSTLNNQLSDIKTGPTFGKAAVLKNGGMNVVLPIENEQFGSSVSRIDSDPRAPLQKLPTGNLDFLSGISQNNTNSGFLSRGFFDETDSSINGEKNGTSNPNKASDDIMSIFGWSPMQSSLF